MATFGPDNEWVKRGVRGLVNLVKNVSFIVGIGALLLMDIVFGANYYGSALQTLPHGQQVFLGYGLSIATTAVQITAWSMLDKTSIRAAVSSWTSRVAFGAVVGLTVLDTIADLGALTQFVYKDAPNMSIIPHHATAGFWVMAGVVLIMTTFNEPMLSHFLDKAKNGGGHTDMLGMA